MSMRKIFCLFVVLLMPAIFLQAQTVTSKSFNEIKRSKQYFYYDITMESEDEQKMQLTSILPNLSMTIVWKNRLQT